MKIGSKPTATIVNGYRKQRGLAPHGTLDDTFSPFAQISQQVEDFDFPRKQRPQCLHYVGPIRGPLGASPDFPWERLDGRPLIYASLGTVVNAHTRIYRCIAEACAEFPVQLVLSLGGAAQPGELTNLPGSPLVVSYAPQVDLIRRAVLTISHCGLNTVLESLGEGVPVVGVPITFEQPAVATRLRWTHTGEFVRAGALTKQRLRTALAKVLDDSSYRQAAHKIQCAIKRSGGSSQAAAIIDEVIRTKRPVTRGLR